MNKTHSIKITIKEYNFEGMNDMLLDITKGLEETGEVKQERIALCFSLFHKKLKSTQKSFKNKNQNVFNPRDFQQVASNFFTSLQIEHAVITAIFETYAEISIHFEL